MIETYKFRLYPNEDQKVLLAKHFGSVRFVYNWALEFNQKLYASEQKYKNSIAMCCDRDMNAAINIRNFALRNIFKNTEGSSGINACGVGSSGKHNVNCACETTDNEARKILRISTENGNGL